MAEVTITLTDEQAEWLRIRPHDTTLCQAVIAKVKAALPEPEWEPDEMLVRAYGRYMNSSDRHCAANALKGMHAAGIRMTVAEATP